MVRTEGAAPSADELAILRLINRWIVYRDTGDWERLRAIWHEDGTMTAGWRRGPVDDFIAASKARWDSGKMKVMHQLGGTEIDLEGDRAISQSKVTILARATLDGIMCDVTCMARHFDRWEKRAGLWGLKNRETIYDRDRIEAVVPGEVPSLDQAFLQSYNEAFRHMAYVFDRLGMPIPRDFPALNTPEASDLVHNWREWLRGTGR